MKQHFCSNTICLGCKLPFRERFWDFSSNSFLRYICKSDCVSAAQFSFSFLGRQEANLSIVFAFRTIVWVQTFTEEVRHFPYNLINEEQVEAIITWIIFYMILEHFHGSYHKARTLGWLAGGFFQEFSRPSPWPIRFINVSTADLAAITPQCFKIRYWTPNEICSFPSALKLQLKTNSCLSSLCSLLANSLAASFPWLITKYHRALGGMLQISVTSFFFIQSRLFLNKKFNFQKWGVLCFKPSCKRKIKTV